MRKFLATFRQGQIMWYSQRMAQIGRRTKNEQNKLEREIYHLHFNGVSVAEIGAQFDLKPDTIKKYIAKMRKMALEDAIGPVESKVELIERANRVARAAAQGHASARENSFSGQVAFLKVQLEVIDRLAKLTGAYEASKIEITGANGGAVQMQMIDHAIDGLNAEDLAKRLRNWADALEEVGDGQQAVQTVVETASEDV
jgi:DNA-binding CsgD family transcriptional regulator